MPESDRPLFAGLKGELGRTKADLTRMLQLRWELARLELGAASSTIMWLGIFLVVAVVMVLVALPVLVISLAGWLDRVWQLPYGLPWSLVLGLALAVGGLLLAWLAWRRFRRDFTGLEETIAELREDVVWFEEWTGRNAHEEANSPDS